MPKHAPSPRSSAIYQNYGDQVGGPSRYDAKRRKVRQTTEIFYHSPRDIDGYDQLSSFDTMSSEEEINEREVHLPTRPSSLDATAYSVSKSRTTNSAASLPVAKPFFGSDWNLPKAHPPSTQRKLEREKFKALPLPLGNDGKPKGPLQLGSRVKLSR